MSSGKASMDVIAKKLGVSKNTVSLAFRGMPGISDQTRKLIMDTARQYGYEYKKKALQLSDSGIASGNICLVLSKSLLKVTGFYSMIQFGIENEAKKHNQNILLHYYDNTSNEFEVPLSIKQGMVSGIITLGPITRHTLKSISGLGLPFVVIDEYFDDYKLDYILTDNVNGGFAATEYLIRCGHKKIGFSGDIHCASSFYDRYLGFLKAMEIYNLPVDSSFVLTDRSLCHLDTSHFELAAEEFKCIDHLPTAFFCCNDPESFALYKALASAGLNVPEDVSIMGFDDIDTSRDVSPQLTTMHVEKEFMGKRAVKRLLEIMKNAGGLTEKIVLPSHLVERQSVRKIRPFSNNASSN